MWVYKEKPQYSLLKYLQEKGKARQGKTRQGKARKPFSALMLCKAANNRKNNNNNKGKKKKKHNYIDAREVWNIFFSEVSNLNEIYN